MKCFIKCFFFFAYLFAEHRNMPLDDALKLLSRNFHEHIRSQRENLERERAERGQYVGVVADREIQFLLKMLAEGRWISLTEINIVIRYLSERRDKMQAASGEDRAPGRMSLPPSDTKMDSSFKPSKCYSSLFKNKISFIYNTIDIYSIIYYYIQSVYYSV